MFDRAFQLLLALPVLGGLALPACAAPAPEDCDGQLVYVDDPASVGANYPLFMKTRRNLYVLRGSCFNLSGGEFRGSITLFTFSRAPEGFNGSYGILVVKSVKTYAGKTQPKKIKLTRNKNWYLPKGTKQDELSIAEPFDDFPIGVSVTDWNSLHDKPISPEQFEGLGVQWHAYPTNDKMISSTMWAEFWKVEDPSNIENRTITNYLLRFSTNPDMSSQNRVPFYVVTTNDVRRVDLSIDSNIGSLHATYTFNFK